MACGTSISRDLRSGLRSIAFYLPQYHPIPENDAWWGRGFTEWSNVVKERPRFRGHYQPHLPRDLGFYDLRLEEVREAQAALARDYGVDGFCYYHYWFEGKRLLERPFEEVLGSGQPDFPFMLCWANENWTRVWNGADREVLQAQTYSPSDDRRHIRSLLPAFLDPRYMNIDRKPVFLVYAVSALPDPAATAKIWRNEVEQAGLPGIYLCRVEHLGTDRGDPRPAGFDAGVEFKPDFDRPGRRVRPNLAGRAVRRFLRPRSGLRWNNVYEYDELVESALADTYRQYVRFPCVTPSWDNSARRERGAVIFRGATPEKYGHWLEEVIRSFIPPSAEEDLIFTNAWNEWAEGNHLEPDLRWGLGYLEEHARAVAAYKLDAEAFR
jgi:Glycosyltransferase WbsX